MINLFTNGKVIHKNCIEEYHNLGTININVKQELSVLFSVLPQKPNDPSENVEPAPINPMKVIDDYLLVRVLELKLDTPFVLLSEIEFVNCKGYKCQNEYDKGEPLMSINWSPMYFAYVHYCLLGLIKHLYHVEFHLSPGYLGVSFEFAYKVLF